MNTKHNVLAQFESLVKESRSLPAFLWKKIRDVFSRLSIWNWLYCLNISSWLEFRKEIFMIYRLTHYIRLSDSRKFDQFSWWSRWQLGQFYSTEIHFQVSLRFKWRLRKLIHVELEEFDEGSYQTNLARTSQNELTAILRAKSLGMCMQWFKDRNLTKVHKWHRRSQNS